MLPSVLAKQLQQGLSDYIETTFPMSNYAFKGSLSRMLNTRNAVFREPYIAVRLPFRVAEENTVKFDAIHSKYKPYLHQQKALRGLRVKMAVRLWLQQGPGAVKRKVFFIRFWSIVIIIVVSLE